MRQSTVVLLLILAGTLFAAWFFTTHEKVTKDEYVGYQGEARVNEFLAAELLLTELEFEADSRESLTPSDWLPVNSDTIVTRLSATTASSTEQELLIDWVANGGHLILLPAMQESRLTEEFLAHLGVRYFEVETAEPEDLDDEATDDDQDDESESYDYIIDLDNTRFRIEMIDGGWPGATLSDDQGVVAARREWESGYVTVFANHYFISNGWIDENDNARLLLDAVAGYIDPGKIWFIYDSAFPSLWQVIWTNAPYGVIGFAVALALWLWSITPMFGPAVAAESMTRRSIVEHISAAGHFVWRHRGTKALGASSTAAVIHEAESRHPGINRLPMESQAKQIARITGIPAQEILEVLLNQDEPRHREFTHNMQTLQRIRKEL